MTPTLISGIACTLLSGGMILVSTIFYQLGRRMKNGHKTLPEISGAIIGAVFALLGLMIAFTFSGAYSRYDARRQLIVDEANAISTAYLRLDLLSPQDQHGLKSKIREYAQTRAAMYDDLNNLSVAQDNLAVTAALENEIWKKAVEVSSGPEHQTARMLLLPALNEMFDVVTTRSNAMRTHAPLPIFLILFFLAIACAGLTGYRSSALEHVDYFYNTLLAVLLACVIYLILDIEYPRFGLIRLDTVNTVLVDEVEKMK